MCDSIHDRCNSKEPNGKQSNPESHLQPDCGQDPNGEPGQIKTYEEVLRPGRETKQGGKTNLKPGHKLFQEMRALGRDSNQEEAYGSLTTSPADVYRFAQDCQEKRHDGRHRDGKRPQVPRI